MIFVDTGAFMAKYLEADQHHSQAIPIWDRIEHQKERFCTSNFIIDELATLLARRTSYSFAAQKVRGIYESELVEIFRPTEEDELTAIDFFAKYSDQEVSFTDCVSFAMMKARGFDKVFCFDRHFDLPGFTRIPLVPLVS